MSGGSYDYAYRKIEELASSIAKTTPLRKAFCKHLDKVAKACFDIEWVDSGNCGPGDEDKAIRECLGANAGVLVIGEAIAEAQHAETNLKKAIEDAMKEKNK
jgi:hypothetical protein